MVSAIALLEWKRKTIIVCRCSSSIGSKLIRNDLMKLFLRIFSHFSSTQLKNQIANFTDQDERFAIEKRPQKSSKTDSISFRHGNCGNRFYSFRQPDYQFVDKELEL